MTKSSSRRLEKLDSDAPQHDKRSVCIPLSRIQKLIGRRMSLSKKTKPCFYLEVSADTTDLMEMRHTLKKSLGVKITSNAFYIRALGLAVKEYPLMLGALDGDNIRIAGSINVGFAVNAPQGLVVPVVKNADQKSLAQIAELEKVFADNARSNKLTLDDITGETVAISNLGAYGIDSFFGIVPPPATTILAAGNTIKTPVPRNGQIAIRKITSMTLAVDSRIVSEFYAARFFSAIIDRLENPRKLM